MASLTSNRNNVPTPTPTGRPVDIAGTQGQVMRAALAAASDVNSAAYFAAKMTKPSWKQVLFTAATGPTISYEFSGNFDPMSVVVFNATTVPVYVSTGGANPLATGIPAQPNAISPRLPIAAQTLVLGLNPTQVNLADTQYLIHIFYFATPD